jgi:hypothetical protein
VYFIICCCKNPACFPPCCPCLVIPALLSLPCCPCLVVPALLSLPCSLPCCPCLKLPVLLSMLAFDAFPRCLALPVSLFLSRSSCLPLAEANVRQSTRACPALPSFALCVFPFLPCPPYLRPCLSLAIVLFLPYFPCLALIAMLPVPCLSSCSYCVLHVQLCSPFFAIRALRFVK